MRLKNGARFSGFLASQTPLGMTEEDAGMGEKYAPEPNLSQTPSAGFAERGIYAERFNPCPNRAEVP